MAPRILAVAAAAWVAAGCLEAPPEGGSATASDAGPDASMCAPARDTFEDLALGDLWSEPVRSGATGFGFQDGALVLSAQPDAETPGNVELSARDDQELAGNLLRAELQSFNEGLASSGVGWHRAPDDFFLIDHSNGFLRSIISLPGGGETQVVCAPCADYVAGQNVIAELREENGMIRFSVTVEGVLTELGQAADTGRAYPAYIYAYAPVDMADLRVEEVSWTDCSSM